LGICAALGIGVAGAAEAAEGVAGMSGAMGVADTVGAAGAAGISAAGAALGVPEGIAAGTSVLWTGLGPPPHALRMAAVPRTARISRNLVSLDMAARLRDLITVGNRNGAHSYVL
jgi:hypothetical protein